MYEQRPLSDTRQVMKAIRSASDGLTAPFKAASGGDLASKAYLNTLAGVLEYAARIVVAFVLTPVLVGQLGDYLYGALQVLIRATGYVSTASGRPSQALKWTIASLQGSATAGQKRRYVGSALAVWFLFLPVLLALGGLFTWFAPTLFGAPSELVGTIRLAAGLLVVEVIVITLVQVPRSVLIGENLGYKRMALSISMVFAKGGLVAIALYAGAGLAGVVSAYLVATLLTGVLMLHVTRANVPWFGIARTSRGDLRNFTGLSGWFFAWRLVSRSLETGDVILLGILGTLNMVTTYSLTRFSSEGAMQLTVLAVFSAMPGLGGIIGSGNLEKAALVRSEIMSLTWIAMVPMGVAILVWNRSFVGLWVGSEHYAGGLITLLMVLMAIQIVLIRTDGSIIDLTLDLRRKVEIGALSTAISIALATLFVSFFKLGLLGLCLGLISGRAILSLAYPWLVGRFLGVSLISQIKKVGRPFLVAMLFLSASLSLGNQLAVSSWSTLLILVSATLIAATALAFYTGLSGNQRMRIVRRATLVLRPAK